MDIIVHSGAEEATVRKLISETKPPFEISFTHIPYPEMGVGDCTRDLKVLSSGECYIKQGMHGSAGIWKQETMQNAVSWLVEAALNNFRIIHSHKSCIYTIKTLVGE
jgi:hypothetical protein